MPSLAGTVLPVDLFITLLLPVFKVTLARQSVVGYAVSS